MDVVLALGGGGIRGVGHIPVLEALDDLGLRPAAIAGTSIGALVGVVYAAGFRGQDLRTRVVDLASNKAKAIWSMVSDPRNRPLGGVLSAEAVYDLCVPNGMPVSFDGLELPFSAMATDYFSRECVALNSGLLRTAVAASIAIPGVFGSVQRNGRTLVDGGLVRNLPVLDLPDGFLIAVDVLDGPSPNAKTSRLDAAVGAMRIMIKHQTAADLKSREPDLLLEPKIAGVDPLDFGRIEEVLDVNTRLGDEVKRALESRLEAADR